VQPQLARSLFRFNPASGSLSAVMGQRQRVAAFAAFETDAAELRAAASPAEGPQPGPAEPAPLALEPLEALAFDAAATIPLPLPLARMPEPPPTDALAATPPPAVLSPAPATTDTGLEDDAEMRDIFIEEAREVIMEARAALERLADAPEDSSDLTGLRRAFHTLKGSSRMVGLRDFGEAGWACEQLYNDRLATAPRMDNPLRVLTAEALAYLADWTEAIAEDRSGQHQAADLARAAEALRLRGERLTIALPGAPAPVALPSVAEPPAPPALPLFRDDDDKVPYEEVGQRLGMSVGSIGPTRSRCLGKLRGLV
jgi:chemosensory pili system protein ChpA (sensor histidine kinase/response regulator)